MNDFFEMLGLLFAFVVVLLLCYLTTRIVGKKLSGRAKNKNMRILETLPLGTDKCLYLIAVGKKHFIFFSSKKGLEMVEIELEEQADNIPADDKTTNVFDFKRIFETYSGLSRRTNKEQASDMEEGFGTMDSSYGGAIKESAENHGEPGEGVLNSIKRLKKINAKND